MKNLSKPDIYLVLSFHQADLRSSVAPTLTWTQRSSVIQPVTSTSPPPPPPPGVIAILMAISRCCHAARCRYWCPVYLLLYVDVAQSVFTLVRFLAIFSPSRARPAMAGTLKGYHRVGTTLVAPTIIDDLTSLSHNLYTIEPCTQQSATKRESGSIVIASCADGFCCDTNSHGSTNFCLSIVARYLCCHQLVSATASYLCYLCYLCCHYSFCSDCWWPTATPKLLTSALPDSVTSQFL